MLSQFPSLCWEGEDDHPVWTVSCMRSLGFRLLVFFPNEIRHMVIDADRAERRCPLYNFSVYIQSFEIAPDGLACLCVFTYREVRRRTSPASDLLWGTEFSSDCRSGKPSRCGLMKKQRPLAAFLRALFIIPCLFITFISELTKTEVYRMSDKTYQATDSPSTPHLQLIKTPEPHLSFSSSGPSLHCHPATLLRIKTNANKEAGK